MIGHMLLQVPKGKVLHPALGDRVTCISGVQAGSATPHEPRRREEVQESLDGWSISTAGTGHWLLEWLTGFLEELGVIAGDEGIFWKRE